MQEKEVGDGTNFVLIFGGQLLQNAAELLNMVILKLTITIINTKLLKNFSLKGSFACRNNRRF